MPATSLPTTKAEFHDQLAILIRGAETEGVDVAGGYPVLTDDGGQRNWDVEVIRMEDPPTPTRG